MTSVGILLYTLITITSAGQQLVASPKIIQYGLTKKLQIECISTSSTNSTIIMTTGITILFSNNKKRPRFGYRGSIDLYGGLRNYSEAVDFAEIVADETSRLSLTWKYPKQKVVGVYKCEVEGTTITGERKTEYLTAEVTSEIPKAVTILNHIQSITKDLEELTDRLERWKSKFFHVSNSFQGSRYYLSPGSNVLVLREAEAMCELFGSYLVEIDSAEEHQFIVSFIRKFPQNHIVLTGGSDEGSEDWWFNIHSKTRVRYTAWAPGQLNGGRDENCLVFRKDDGYKMGDERCEQVLFDKFGAYICEKDE